MTKIETAAERLHVRTVAEYRAKFLRDLQKKGLVEQPQAEPLEVWINAGAWVTPCACSGGVASHPGWDFAGCLSCGRSWTRFIYPSAEELAAIDAVLRQRPERPAHREIPRPYYSWTPGETLAELAQQNVRIAAVRAARARMHPDSPRRRARRASDPGAR